MSNKKTFKRFAVIMIRNDQDDVLMGRRSDTNLYTNPGGGIEEGEDIFVGAAREVLEETGLYLKSIKLLGADIIDKNKLIYTFEGFLSEDVEITAKPDPDEEVQEWSYYDLNDIKEELHIPVDKNLLIKYWCEN